MSTIQVLDHPDVEDILALSHPVAVSEVPTSEEADQGAKDPQTDEKGVKPEPIALHDTDPPDGGLTAYLVVAGIFFSTFSTFGYVNAWGVFQVYYQTELLPNSSPSNIAWIGSLQYSLIFFPGLITGRLFDLGYFRLPFGLASALLVACSFIIAECTKYWHFLLVQGIVVGLACGVIFGPAMGLVQHWFKKKRGLALGIVANGSSIGGTLLPILVQKLVPKVGFPWTMRIIGFIMLFTLGFANLVVRRRLPPVNVSGGLANLSAFKSPPFTIYTINCAVAFLGLYTVLTYINVSAIDVGVPASQAFYMVSIANAASAFGRITSGLLSDKVGAVNIMAPFTAVAGIMTYVWPLARTEKSLIAVAIVYGFSSGAFVGLILAPIMHLGGTGDVGRRVGLTTTSLAFGALAGPPISGAINDATGSFRAVGIYAGTMIMISVVLMCITRHLVLKQLWGRF